MYKALRKLSRRSWKAPSKGEGNIEQGQFRDHFEGITREKFEEPH